MGAVDLQDRVVSPLGKARADAPETQRRLQEGLSQRFSRFVVIIAFPVLLECIGTINVAVVDELGGKNGPVFLECPVQVESFDNYPERIVIPQVRRKIDVPGKYVGQLKGQKQIPIAPFHRGDQVVFEWSPRYGGFAFHTVMGIFSAQYPSPVRLTLRRQLSSIP